MGGSVSSQVIMALCLRPLNPVWGGGVPVGGWVGKLSGYNGPVFASLKSCLVGGGGTCRAVGR